MTHTMIATRGHDLTRWTVNQDGSRTGEVMYEIDEQHTHFLTDVEARRSIGHMVRNGWTCTGMTNGSVYCTHPENDWTYTITDMHDAGANG